MYALNCLLYSSKPVGSSSSSTKPVRAKRSATIGREIGEKLTVGLGAVFVVSFGGCRVCLFSAVSLSEVVVIVVVLILARRARHFVEIGFRMMLLEVHA